MRHTAALTGHVPVKHRSLASSQLWPIPQGLVPPPQTPPVQLCVPLQKFVSSQPVPSATKPLAGQLSLTPSQTSATSQTPADARQVAVLLASLGQVFADPLQTSAESHAPAEARQVVPFGST